VPTATVDVTGLSPSKVAQVEQFVEALRAPPEGARESSADWEARFRAWAARRAPLAHEIDDSRDAVYDGRGE
jgi:2-keto-3-deoxy-L-rhamnonate aldolase RhmA